MNAHRRTQKAALATLLCLVLVTACSGSDFSGASGEGWLDVASSGSSAQGVAPALAPRGEEAADEDADGMDKSEEGEVAPPGEVGGGAAQAPPIAPTGGGSTRKIIKDGTMSLLVEQVELGLSRVDGIAAQAGGYVVETRTEFTDPYARSAFIKIAVPVDRFETTMQRLREAAGEVLSEQASGVDVSEEYTDVQSQIANLEATQARIREFLDQAQTVEEALQVNAQLTEVEGELSQLKGRLQYLEQRAAFSTLAVSLSEPPPEPTITPTPGPTATPTARPPWEPGRTAQEAAASMSRTMRGLGDMLIWLVVGLLPVLLVVFVPLLLIAWAIHVLRGRKASGDQD